MSIIQCSDCKSEISSLAAFCPRCGCPTKLLPPTRKIPHKLQDQIVFYLGPAISLIVIFVGISFFHIVKTERFFVLIPKVSVSFSNTFTSVSEVLEQYNSRSIGDKFRGDPQLDHLVRELARRRYIFAESNIQDSNNEKSKNSSVSGTVSSQVQDRGVENSKKEMAISPTSLPNFRSFELGEAVLFLMPLPGYPIGWNWLSNSSNIVWLDNGYVESQDESFRRGAIRVNVLGVRSTILEQKLEELPWMVTLHTKGVAKFGPQEIRLKPGLETCFGSLFTGCDFETKPSLQKAGIEVYEVCRKSIDNSNYTQVYKLVAPGKALVFLSESRGAGSGGASAALALLLNTTKEQACLF